MSISSIGLDAFFEVAKLESFSKAAKNIGVTQSALSQRIKNLELDLGCTLFIRDNANISLTESGVKLFRYTQMRESIEEEVLGEIQSNYSGEYNGVIRIGAFSSVLRSIIIPALSPFLRSNPKVQCEFIKGEMSELPSMLKSGAVDIIIIDYHMDKKGINESVLGKEEYIVIKSPKYNDNENIYLDHGPKDNATESFFAAQTKKPKGYRRTFMGDVYGILDGVSLGLGRAVMSKHLVDPKKFKIIKGYKAYKRDMTLHYFDQSYYPQLFKKVLEELEVNSKKILS
jgi:DNA-binding transcriptional LysR family regulator